VWFHFVGALGPECLAKVCGVDLRLHRFADLTVAQTSLARLSTVIVRDDRSGGPAFHILADSASALYLWDCLIDAMAEFGGQLLGLDDLPGA
jgi:sarcosine oxidase subunit gamma